MDVHNSIKTFQRVFRWIVIIGVFALIGFGVKTVIDDIVKPKPLISLGKATFRVELARTEAEHQKGLSGRTKLADEEAMLFEFSEDRPWGIWMKGMKIPIDIVWLDRDMRVVHIEVNAQPDAEPYKTYKPPVSARYVLELVSGGTSKFDIKNGMTAKLYNDSEKS